MKRLPDIVGVIGLLLIGGGCWYYSPGVAAIVVGSLLFLLSGLAFYQRLPRRSD